MPFGWGGKSAGDLPSSDSEPEADRQSEEEPDEETKHLEYEQAAMGGGAQGEGDSPLGSGGDWKGQLSKNFDAHLRQRMEAAHIAGPLSHPGAKNAGAGYAEYKAAPLAPRNGFYDERYVCSTLPQDEIDEEFDFQFLLGEEMDGVPPPSRVTLALKGLSDLHVAWIAKFLNEESLQYGDAIRKWREAEGGPFGVRQLWLNDNPITATGAMHLANALKCNQTVEELYLHYTSIGDAGLDHLLEMLGKNSTLKKLEVGCCGITERGAKAVVKAFSRGGVCASNGTLEHLGLFSNQDEIDDDLPAIYDLLEEDSRRKRGGGKGGGGKAKGKR